MTKANVIWGGRPDDDMKLDSIALAAARNTYDSYDSIEAAPGEPQPDPLHAAISSYITTAKVRGLAHELKVIPGGVEGYEPLARVLELAYDQSAKGKGKERHSKGYLPFNKQPIMEIGRMLGSAHGEMYQVIKKVQEASGMAARGNASAAKAELLGAIVYAAASYLLIEESGQ